VVLLLLIIIIIQRNTIDFRDNGFKVIFQAALIGVAMSGDTNNNKSAYKKTL
jgi:hypothetical protein